MSKKSSVGSFVGGLLVGAGLGVLFAPKKGSETREDLKNLFDEMVTKVKDIKPDEVKDAIEKKIEYIKNEIKELDKEKVLAVAKEKGAVLKEKCEDLIEYAKEKSMPAVEKTAKELKAKTADVVRDVLAKLEN